MISKAYDLVTMWEAFGSEDTLNLTIEESSLTELLYKPMGQSLILDIINEMLKIKECLK